MKRSSRLTILGYFLAFVALFSVVYIFEHIDIYIAEHRLKRFNNLGLTIANTKSIHETGKSGSYINYVYSVNGVFFGGTACINEYSFKYPDYE